MVSVFIGVGSNLGDRSKNIKQAVDLLSNSQGIAVVKVSALRETKSQGSIGPDYLNGVVKINTNLLPDKLLEVLQDIESRLQRVRTFKNAPRTIDLDILLYGEQVIRTSELDIPHPRMFEREFVMGPLLEIEPKIMDQDQWLSKLI